MTFILDEASTSMEQISIRLDPKMSERAESIAKALAGRPEFKAFRLTRAAVLRMAMIEGLEVLAERYALEPEPPPVPPSTKRKR